MKILNVDALTQISRQISIGGKTYPVLEPMVQEFIDNLKAAEAIEDARAAGVETPEKQLRMSEAMEQGLETIFKSIPSLPKELLLKQGVVAVMAILQFIRGELDPSVIEAQQKASGDDEGPDAKKAI